MAKRRKDGEKDGRFGTRENTHAALAVAAEMRVRGNSWEEIAKAIGRKTADSARHLPREYPAEWAAAFEGAYDELMPEVEAESILVLRENLRPLMPLRNAQGIHMQDDEGHLLYTPRPGRTIVGSGKALLEHVRRSKAKRIELTGAGGGPIAVTGETIEEIRERLRKMDTEDLIKLSHGIHPGEDEEDEDDAD